MIVTHLTWMVYRLASSNKLMRYAQMPPGGSWWHGFWKHRPSLKSWVISHTNLWKESFLMSSSVLLVSIYFLEIHNSWPVLSKLPYTNLATSVATWASQTILLRTTSTLFLFSTRLFPQSLLSPGHIAVCSMKGNVSRVAERGERAWRGLDRVGCHWCCQGAFWQVHNACSTWLGPGGLLICHYTLFTPHL